MGIPVYYKEGYRKKSKPSLVEKMRPSKMMWIEEAVCAQCGKVSRWQETTRAKMKEVRRAQGWRTVKGKWTCAQCAPAPDGRIKKLDRTCGAGKLLQIWYLAGEWKAVEFQAAMGIGKARLYSLRRKLELRGLVDFGASRLKVLEAMQPPAVKSVSSTTQTQ